MLDMVDVEYIRKLNLVQHWSVRQIAKRLGISRNTVTKYLSAPDPTPRRKQRHTAHRIYERLRDEYFFPGGESTIRKYVRRVKAPVPEAFLPLEYELGSEAQCDFGEADVIFAGVQITIHLFCMRLMAGARSFVVALRSHYLFESIYCLPGRKGAHEKGGVENLVGYCRRNYLVPLPEVKDFDELNTLLKERCLDRVPPQPQSPAPILHALTAHVALPDLTRFDRLLAGVAG